MLYSNEFNNEFSQKFQDIARNNICERLEVLKDTELGSAVTEKECKEMLEGVLTQGLYATLIYLFDIIYTNIDYHYILVDKYSNSPSVCSGNYWECESYKLDIWMHIFRSNLLSIVFVFPTTILHFIEYLILISNDYAKKMLTDAYNRNLIMLIVIIVVVVIIEIVCIVRSYQINKQVVR
eukprot:TRINITY_DN17098_c0_g1_i2.p1 TRINITY_DN17098_c0_g1~~TRINITY_DN17098_c0_g1_i2.p1  ORF type:complete len:180 (+),score=44.10 TRINITY_DN17098_c0_g1_i2:145-684(+)